MPAFTCLNCNYSIQIPDSHVGSSFKCPSCQTVQPLQRIVPSTAPVFEQLNVGCPHCSNPIRFDPARAGQVLACPHCSQRFRMPSGTPKPQAPPIPPPAPAPPPVVPVHTVAPDQSLDFSGPMLIKSEVVDNQLVRHTNRSFAILLAIGILFLLCNGFPALTVYSTVQKHQRILDQRGLNPDTQRLSRRIQERKILLAILFIAVLIGFGFIGLAIWARYDPTVPQAIGLGLVSLVALAHAVNDIAIVGAIGGAGGAVIGIVLLLTKWIVILIVILLLVDGFRAGVVIRRREQRRRYG